MECANPTCFVPETSCSEGCIRYQECPNWKAGEQTPGIQQVAEEQIILPWTGSALGLADAAFISGREKPLVVAIAGPESAGKTTLLASWYLLLGRGTLLEPGASFNGSYSLTGWEAIAASLRWRPGQPPAFPAHTSSRDARAPGLLHLSLRTSAERTRDILLADAPGAWFQRWAVDEQAGDAEGARWIARHADVILLVADRQALSGARMGTARNAFQLLAKRIAAERRDRPVALVWTKADVEVPAEMEKVVRAAVFDDMPDSAEFMTSARPGPDGESAVVAALGRLFAWVVAARRPGTNVGRGRGSVTDALFLYGRRSDDD